jgi:RNA polymerase sigma-70 factor (ECF subfamily)
MNETQWAAWMVAGQAGDQVAYASLLHDCIPFIRFVGSGVGVPAAHLDDLVQEVLLAIHRARQTYDPRQPFKPWLRTIAQRRAIDILRRIGRQRQRELHDPDQYQQHPDPAPNAALALAGADDGARLRREVALLPGGQREAVELLGLQELTLDEAASVTGRTKIALKVNLHRAIKSLRQRLERNA